jgi:alpha-amylase
MKSKLIVFTLFFCFTVSASVTLTSTSGDGVILDCWQWPFSRIQNNLSVISAVGYSAVQVSPLQLTKSSSATISWYLFYQPCNLKVGNAQLGTEQDFVNLCSAAKPYNIKIIVDAVLNQVADNGTDGSFDPNVDSTIRANASTWFHNNGTCQNWQNRYDMTQQNLGNGPDWNTQNPTVQAMHLAFLNQCIADGAGGFRFDAAKSIETNVGIDAGQTWSGAYWSTMTTGMTNASSLFYYAEVLPDVNDNELGYQTFMRTTTTGYLSQISSAIDSQTLTSARLNNRHNVDTGYDEIAARSVVYIENWDNCASGITGVGDVTGVNTAGFSYKKRLLANAIMASRAGMVDIVFARPNENLWNDPVLSAVNNFKNYAFGASETLRNPSASTVIIERGTVGMVIINAGTSQSITSPTNIPNGTYVDKGPSGAAFVVANGTLTGIMPATTAIVLQTGVTATAKSTAMLHSPLSSGNAVKVLANGRRVCSQEISAFSKTIASLKIICHSRLECTFIVPYTK